MDGRRLPESQEPTAAVADEFGLPVKQFMSAESQMLPASHQHAQEARISNTAGASNSSEAPQPEQRAETDAQQEATISTAASDSDEATFEDAPNYAISASADDGSGACHTQGASEVKGQRDRALAIRAVESSAYSDSRSEPLSRQERGHDLQAARSFNPDKTPMAENSDVSQYSHQPLSAPREDENKPSDEGWQEMPSYARYDMYDDNDRLVAREHDENEDETYGYGGLGGAGKGYTRVVVDEDAQSATSMDEHTQYLFKESNGTSLMGNDDEARDAVSQMQATKDLLTEGQRIAYVGVVRLEIAKLVRDAEQIESTKKTRKELATAAEAMKMWGQKMMIRLYGHMEISGAEQIMIEQLAEHGVVPRDLTPALHANSRVKNPLAKASEDGGDDGRNSQETSLQSAEEATADPPPPYESTDSSDVPEVHTPSQLPKTDRIDIDLRWTVLCDLFLILIADSIYDARSRLLLERVGASIDITCIDICKFEKKVTDALEMQQAAEKENWNEDEHMESRRKMALKRRYVMMGLATVGGGLVIGLSAGLLAPVIGAGLAAGFTTLGVSGTGGFLAGAGGAAIITSSAAASGSIIGGRAANRRTGAVKTFEYRPLHNNKRVNLIVTVAGWLTGKMDDVRLPFSTVDPVMGDIYSVLWEPEMLRSMGDTINILATEALTQGLQQILGSTILVSLMAALQLPIVLSKLSYLIDNPWAVSLDRATSAGLILADSLLERSLGTRPITLVGYSLGARVIFSCLQELARRSAFGLIQNVYLFGSPVVVKKEEYLRAKTVVAGRFVNGYNRNDWILGYLFRLTNGGIRRVAGLAAVEGCPWLENMDVSELVPGHMEYRKAIPTLLMKCGWEVESEEFTEIEDPDPENHNKRQRELINEIEEARKELEKEGKAKKGGRFGIFGRRKKAGRQEWEVYEQSADQNVDRAAEEAGANHGVLFDVEAIRAELAKEVSADVPMEELQVRELQSTLPPMKLDLPPFGRQLAGASLDMLRETKSVDDLPDSGSNEARRDPSAAEALPEEARDEEIQMTFETSFQDSEVSEKLSQDKPSSRPSIQTSQTLPNMSLKDPWADPDDEEFGKEREISMTFA